VDFANEAEKKKGKQSKRGTYTISYGPDTVQMICYLFFLVTLQAGVSLTAFYK
jgi:hypothetical protein